MPDTVSLKVQLIAKTEFLPPADVPWETDADGGQALCEFAGRACYQSWKKPNPATATNAGYLRTTDLDWFYGSGSLLRGTGEDIALVLCGRTIPAERLEGDPLLRPEEGTS